MFFHRLQLSIEQNLWIMSYTWLRNVLEKISIASNERDYLQIELMETNKTLQQEHEDFFLFPILYAN